MAIRSKRTSQQGARGHAKSPFFNLLNSVPIECSRIIFNRKAADKPKTEGSPALFFGEESRRRNPSLRYRALLPNIRYYGWRL